MGKKGNDTTTTNTAPNPEAMSAYRSLLDRASGVASTPYNPYGGDLTAGINAQQQAGFANINQNANFASPYIQQGAQYATSLGNGPTQANLDPYMNPFQQNVVDQTQAQFNRSNAAQQNDLRSRAASQGALGGSRANVAAGDLAYNQQLGQAPAIANLYAQNYNQAVGNWGQNARYASGQFGNLGVSGQQAALAGAGAQVGAGSLQQQTEQQRLSALYNQFQIASAFPYQQTQWLAGLDTGVGSQMGGTSSTTAPSPSLWQMIAGNAAMAAGASAGKKFDAGGGVGGYADGGDVGSGVSGIPYSVSGFIPGVSIVRGPGAPRPPGSHQPDQMKQPSFGSGFASGLGNKRSGDSGVSGAPDWWSPAPREDSADMWQGPPSASEVYRSGGVVNGYATRGFVSSDDDDLSFPDANVGKSDRLSMSYSPPDNKTDFHDRDTAMADPFPGELPETYKIPDAWNAQKKVPAGGFDGVSGPPPTSDGSGWEPAPRAGSPATWQGAPMTPPPSRATAADSEDRGLFGLNWTPIPKEMGAPLMTAGAAMLASRSGNFYRAFGEGALAGVGTYQHQQEKTADRSIRKQSLDMQSRRLDEAAQRARETLALRTRALDEQTAYRNDQTDARNRPTYHPTGALTEDGHPILADTRGQAPSIDAITGKPIQEGAKVNNPKASGLFDDDTVKFLASQYLAGDKSVFQNLGRGAQGPENIAKLRAEVRKQAEEKGLKGPDAAALVANFGAQAAAARSQAIRAGNIEGAIEESKNTFPLALQASKNVPRTQFVPLNKAIQMVESGTSSPELARFVTANQAVITAYSLAMNRGASIPTVHAQQEAKQMLSTATSPEAYAAVIDQMQLEMKAAKDAPDTVRQMILDRISGRSSGHSAPAAPAAAAPAQDQNARALDWANKNPNDPRAAAIKKRLGVQ